MPSAFIPSGLGYPVMHLAVQPVHQWSVHPGPLVLRTAPLKHLTPAPDRDAAGLDISVKELSAGCPPDAMRGGETWDYSVI